MCERSKLVQARHKSIKLERDNERWRSSTICAGANMRKIRRFSHISQQSPLPPNSRSNIYVPFRNQPVVIFCPHRRFCRRYGGRKSFHDVTTVLHNIGNSCIIQVQGEGILPSQNTKRNFNRSVVWHFRLSIN